MNDREFDKALKKLQQDRVRGASELARGCLQLMAASARDASAADSNALLQLLDSRALRLAASRPSMTPVQNLIEHWRNELPQLADKPLTQLRTGAAEAAQRWIQRSGTALSQAAEIAADFMGADKTIITHSLSSTVVEVFNQLKTRNVRALVSESRPLNEGHLLARQLADWQIPTQLFTDAQLGLFASQADLALVGADSLLPDGSLINKSGTLLLALAAREASIPFYVCCESYKRRPKAMGEPTLEEMAIEELAAPLLPGVEVRNIYFDITPARLIDCWIDESGVHRSPDH